MSVAAYLVDTSALVRILRDPWLRARWEPQITSGRVATCPIVELEVLHTARSAADRRELNGLLRQAFSWVPMPDTAFDRATEVQELMTERGTHRSAGAVDLLVAAAGEVHRLTLLHYDRDFETVADVTGQQTTWVAAPGTVP